MDLNGITVDTVNIAQGQGTGDLASRLLANGMNVGALRPFIGTDKKTGLVAGNFINVNGQVQPVTNALLRKDEWKLYDEALLKAARVRLGGVADLYDANLVYNISNGMGTTVLEYENIGEVEPAQMDMDGVTEGRNDRPEFTMAYLPLPIIHADFQINIRPLASSRTKGQALDTTTAELKTRQIMEYLETLLFVGTGGITYGGGTIYGYSNHPSINTVTLSVNWDASAKTGALIKDDVLDMKQASIDARHYGPWVLYIPTAYEKVLDDDYVSGYPKTIRQRLIEIDGITKIKVIDKLAANTVLMVQMTSDVVRMVNGLPLTTVEWDTKGGMISHFKIMTIQVPQIRADVNSRTGIVKLAA